jgi:hypothetical protein
MFSQGFYAGKAIVKQMSIIPLDAKNELVRLPNKKQRIILQECRICRQLLEINLCLPMLLPLSLPQKTKLTVD